MSGGSLRTIFTAAINEVLNVLAIDFKIFPCNNQFTRLDVPRSPAAVTIAKLLVSRRMQNIVHS